MTGVQTCALPISTVLADTGLNDLNALIDYLQANDRAGNPVGEHTPAQRIHKVDNALAKSAQR